VRRSMQTAPFVCYPSCANMPNITMLLSYMKLGSQAAMQRTCFKPLGVYRAGMRSTGGVERSKSPNSLLSCART